MSQAHTATAQDPKAMTIECLKSGVPPELLKRDQWVLYRIEPGSNGKPTKVPYNVKGWKASVTDPATWDTFQKCVVAFEAGSYDGLGYVFSANDPYTGIDLDHHIANDVISAKAQTWLLQLDSYSEYSQSGTGIHIIVKAKKPGTECKNAALGPVEIYDHARWFVMTGKRIPNTTKQILERQQQLDAFYAEVFPPKPPPPQQPQPQPPPSGTVSQSSIDALRESKSDEWLLDKLKKHPTKGSRASKLLAGDGSSYLNGNGTVDESAATMALLLDLAWLTGSRADRMDRMFRHSSLMRSKWNDPRGSSTWGKQQIDEAIVNTHSHYDPSIDDGLEAAVWFANNPQPATATAPTVGHPVSQTLTYTNAQMKNSDTGNARRLVNRHGDIIRYVSEWNKWFTWNGKRWAEDKTLQIEQLAKETVACIFNDAAQLSGSDRDDLWKFGILSEKHSNIRAMVQSARSEPGISIPYDMLNSEPFLLNVRNGIIDLRTGTLQPHDRNRFITKYVDVDYDPNAQCVLWLEFLHKIQNGDADTIEFIQRAVGYTLTGTSREKMWLFMFGAKGNNGKSTFIEVLMALLGDYVVKLSMQTLLQSKFDSGRTRNDIADIVGARLVVASEIEQNRRLNESLMKDLTGGDTLRGNHLYEEGFNFRPTHALWMYGNYKPVIKGTDDAIWGRVRLIPFEVKIPDSEIDTTFGEKLKAELPGILAWAVEGSLKWQQDGLKPSTAVLGGTAQYRGDMDIIGRFLKERCAVGDDPATKKPYQMSMGSLFAEYQNWCSDEDEDELTKAKFGKQLTERGITSFIGSGNVSMRRGIILKSTLAAQP